jgi:hypothetical protein
MKFENFSRMLWRAWGKTEWLIYLIFTLAVWAALIWVILRN